MSTSFGRAIVDVSIWRAERFPLSLFIPATGILTLAGVTGQPLPAMSGLAHRLSFAFVALLGLRLYDDLMDRHLDAHTHPHRVLARADPQPFLLVAALLLGLSFALALARSQVSALVFGLICAGLVAFYRFRPSPLVLLLKYPMLVLVLGELSARRAAAMGVIYSAMVLDEYAQRRSGAGGLRAVWMGMAVILLLLLGLGRT